MVVDADGQRVLSRRIDNDESALLELIRAVTSLAEGGHLTWAIDLNAGGAALLITLLLAHDQELLYIPGQTVHHAAGSYRGDGKTDAKDATIIADQARLRRGDELVAELRILTSRRSDLSADRTRTINRLRERLGEYFPALERAFDYSNNQAALILLTGYQTPAALRRIGTARLETWLQTRHARKVSSVAASAVAAAHTQYTVVPGEQLAADLVARLTQEVIDLDAALKEIDVMIEDRFRRHRYAEIIVSLPGFGPRLGAEFLAALGGDIALYDSADRLAGVAGLAPVPRDSGRVSGNLHRPRRFNRRLLRASYLAAQLSIHHDPASKHYYARKRAEGKRHTQAVLALARRRNNVLWAMLRDHTHYQQPTADRATAA